MKPTKLFHGKIANGRIDLADPLGWQLLVSNLEGKEVSVSLGKRRKVRSLDQNRWYWGCIIPLLSEYTGFEHEELHDALRMKFLQRHDGPLPTVRSTTELDTVEFTEYAEQCRRLAAEMGVYIPNPGEVDYVLTPQGENCEHSRSHQ